MLIMRPYFLANHVPRHGLRHEEGAAQVGVQDQVPIVPGDFQRRFAHVAAGIVDQHIDLAVVRDGGLDHGLDAVEAAHVQRQRQCPAAQRLDLGLERCQRRRVAAGDHEVSPRPRQRTAEVLAQAAAGAGDNGDFARQIKWVLAHSYYPADSRASFRPIIVLTLHVSRLTA